MAELKYAHYVITKPKNYKNLPGYRHDPNSKASGLTRVADLDDDIIKGAFHVGCTWMWPRKEYGKIGVEAHSHPFIEVLGFFGTDPDNTEDLCGEVEFWLEDEKYLLTQSCLVYVPANMRHGPLITRRIDRPIFHFGATSEGNYR